MTHDDLIKQFPADLVEALSQPGGFAKLAQAVHGLPDLEQRTVFKHVGTKLATHMLEQRAINQGLAALAEIEKEAGLAQQFPRLANAARAGAAGLTLASAPAMGILQHQENAARAAHSMPATSLDNASLQYAQAPGR